MSNDISVRMTYRFGEIKFTNDTARIAAFIPGHLPVTFLKVNVAHSVKVNHITWLDYFEILAVGIIEKLDNGTLERQTILNVETKVDELAKVIFGKLLELGMDRRTTEFDKRRREGNESRKEQEDNFHGNGFDFDQWAKL